MHDRSNCWKKEERDQETRRWDDNKESSHAMRSKEDAQDYRYFPEPDLVPIVISDDWIAKIRAQQPELRTESWSVTRESLIFQNTMQRSSQDTKNLQTCLRRQPICGKAEKSVQLDHGRNYASVKGKQHGSGRLRFSPVNLAKLIKLTDAGTIKTRWQRKYSN